MRKRTPTITKATKLVLTLARGQQIGGNDPTIISLELEGVDRSATEETVYLRLMEKDHE